MPIGRPDVRDRLPSGRQNLRNGLLLLAVPVPAIACTAVLFAWFPRDAIPADPGWGWPASGDEAAALLLHHPILTANLLFLVFVDLQFWVIALVQRSSWLIDPYWTLLPLLLAWFYLAHPLAEPDPTRALAVSALLGVWSVRLGWNYLRRERGRLGLREDWRYARMRAERPGFWWEQLFVVHFLQHLLLVGLCLPLWAVAFRPRAFGGLDVLCLVGAGAGIAVAHLADSSLHRFMRANAARVARGEPRLWLLDRGLWRGSRHPNYFGEQLFWWSLAGVGAVCGEPWVAVGAAANSLVLAAVTVMTERRMLAVPERREAYAAYRRRTSVWVPWWPRRRS